jgi:hypothetical protein
VSVVKTDLQADYYGLIDDVHYVARATHVHSPGGVTGDRRCCAPTDRLETLTCCNASTSYVDLETIFLPDHQTNESTIRKESISIRK